jgi:hypothetical protein
VKHLRKKKLATRRECYTNSFLCCIKKIYVDRVTHLGLESQTKPGQMDDGQNVVPDVTLCCHMCYARLPTLENKH